MSLKRHDLESTGERQVQPGALSTTLRYSYFSFYTALYFHLARFGGKCYTFNY